MNDSFLQEQGVSGALIESVRRFRESYPVAEGLENRMSTPEIPFFGKEILEMAIAALLQGENLLLTGEKATGKNVLAETLAYVFGRPTYNVSFHVNTGSAELIGIVNKCFDLFEKEIVRDVVRTRIPEEWTPQDVF